MLSIAAVSSAAYAEIKRGWIVTGEASGMPGSTFAAAELEG
jgi:hypothetical protein